MEHDDGRFVTGAEVLIVDDHYEIAALLAEALTDEGYRVRVAHDGVAALAAIRRRRPNLLLLDVAMPLMSGDQLLLHLKREQLTDFPVILMTADQAPERFRALGAAQVLDKPFDLWHLLRIVGYYTKQAHLRPW